MPVHAGKPASIAARGPTLAGTVLLIRQAPQPCVLMLKRQSALAFMGGFWVFPGGAVDAADAGKDPDDRVGAAAAAACRELREEAGLCVAVSEFVHWAHWITPSALPRRFDTHFFLARAPGDQLPQIAASEASAWRWAERHDWDPSHATDFPLATPTRVVLRELAAAIDAQGSLDALRANAHTRPVRPVLPKMLDGAVTVLPWDAAYATLPGEGLAWDADAIAERQGWPSRLPAATGILA